MQSLLGVFILISLLVPVNAGFAQTDTVYQSLPFPKKRLNLALTERFDLFFSRGFLISSNMPDTVPMESARSGGYQFGAMANVPLGQKGLLLKIGLSLNYYRMQFRQTAKKTFPVDYQYSGSEKLRITYPEFLLGVGYILERDTLKRQITSFIQVGVSVGGKASARYKVMDDLEGYNVAADRPAPDFKAINPFRVGVYGQITYTIFGIWVYYRLTDVFDKQAIFAINARYPVISPLEVGFSLQL